MRRILMLTVVALMAATLAQADFLVNGDFQSINPNPVGQVHGNYLSQLVDGGWDVYSSIEGWTGVDQNGVADPDGLEVQSWEGTTNRGVELDTHGPTVQGDPFSEYLGHNGAMSQSFNVSGAEAGPSTLTFDYRSRSGNPYFPPGSQYGQGVNGGPSTYAIEIYLNGQFVGLQDDWGQTSWKEYSFELNLSEGLNVLTFLGAGVADSLGGLLDNIRVAGGGPTPIPEPSTYLLVGMGLMGVFLFRRRQRA